VAEGQVVFRDEVRGELAAVRKEFRQEFEDTRAIIRLFHGELERRIADLESDRR
jgi:hypothetical protein